MFAPVAAFDWESFDGQTTARRTVTDEDMETIFDAGQRTLTRAEAVKALQELTGLKTAACYKALKTTEDGRFAARLREGDGGALTWA